MFLHHLKLQTIVQADEDGRLPRYSIPVVERERERERAETMREGEDASRKHFDLLSPPPLTEKGTSKLSFASWVNIRLTDEPLVTYLKLLKPKLSRPHPVVGDGKVES